MTSTTTTIIQEDSVVTGISLYLRNTIVLGHPYAISLRVESYNSTSYYFKTLEEAETFYDFKLLELRQALKFTEGGNYGD